MGRARGLGSAKSGVHHFWMQRVSAVALIPLTLWFVFSVAQLSAGSYPEALHWVSSPSARRKVDTTWLRLFSSTTRPGHKVSINASLLNS